MIREANRGIWCDYCKDQWGKVGSHPQRWHEKAMSQAWVTIYSQNEKSKGQKRSYCNPCATTLMQWPTGELFTLHAQVTSMAVANV